MGQGDGLAEPAQLLPEPGGLQGLARPAVERGRLAELAGRFVEGGRGLEAPDRFITITVSLVQPKSRGEIRLRSADPSAAPIVINPSRPSPGSARTVRQSASASSGATPRFATSPVTFTCTRTASRRPAWAEYITPLPP